MDRVESFTVWIYDDSERKNTCSYQKKPKYVFSWNQPGDLPESGFVRLSVTCDETQQHLATIEGSYFYGPKTDDVLVCKYTREELLAIEKILVGEGSFLDRITAQIKKLTPHQERDLIDKFGIPNFGSSSATLVHLFIFLFAVVLVIIAWLNSPRFWENRLLPLDVRFPKSKHVISRNILKLLAIYLVYLYSMKIEIELRPLLDAVITFINIWNDALVDGEDLDTDSFHARLNLGFYKYIIWQIKNSPSHRKIEHQQNEKDGIPLSSDDFILPGGQETDNLSSSTGNRDENFPWEDDKSFPSEEVIGHVMTEVRNRLDSYLEEHLYKLYPGIEKYIQTILREKGDYFTPLKEQLDLEVSQAKEIYQQALLVLETVPCIEKRIRRLENEINALKSRQNNDADLHRKVEYLQSTVTQLLKAVRCRV